MNGSTICLEFCPAPLTEVLTRALTDSGAEVVTRGRAEHGCSCYVVYCDEEASWQRAVEFAPRTATVVVIPRLDFDLIVRALAVGGGVVVLDTATEVFMDVIRAALRGEALVPFAVTTALARYEPPARSDVMTEALTELEKLLSNRLARGSTIGEMANDLGYSERTISRRVQGLYLKLGVRNRAEAIAQISGHQVAAELDPQVQARSLRDG